MDLKADGVGALGMVTAEYLLEVGTAGQEATVGGGRGVNGTQCKPRS